MEASSSEQQPRASSVRQSAGGGLDDELAAADEGAALAVAGAEHAEDEARSSSGRSAVRSSPPMASATEARSCGAVVAMKRGQRMERGLAAAARAWRGAGPCGGAGSAEEAGEWGRTRGGVWVDGAGGGIVNGDCSNYALLDAERTQPAVRIDKNRTSCKEVSTI